MARAPDSYEFARNEVYRVVEGIVGAAGDEDIVVTTYSVDGGEVHFIETLDNKTSMVLSVVRGSSITDLNEKLAQCLTSLPPAIPDGIRLTVRPGNEDGHHTDYPGAFHQRGPNVVLSGRPAGDPPLTARPDNEDGQWADHPGAFGGPLLTAGQADIADRLEQQAILEQREGIDDYERDAGRREDE